MSLKTLGRTQSGRVRLVRAGAAGLGALLLAGCTDGFDIDAWPDVLGEHGHGHSDDGESCGTGGQGEPLAPVEVEPGDASVGVEPDTVITVAFSGPLDPESESAVEVSLLGSEGSPVPGSVAVEACAITFTPSERLGLDAAYTLRLDGSVRGRHGSEWTGALDARLRTRNGVWSEPENVAPEGDRPQLAAGPDGTAVVAWEVPAGAVSASVALAQFTPAEHWQALPVTGASGGPYSIPLGVVVGLDGAIELLWYNTGEVYGAVYRPGQGLGPSTSRDYHASTLDGDGAIAGGLTWLATNEIGGIALQHTSDGSSWSEQMLVPRDVEGEPRPAGPRLTADEDGNVRAFWATATDLYLSSFTSGSNPDGWTAPQALVALDPDYGMTQTSASGLRFPFADAESSIGHSLLAWQEDWQGSVDAPNGVTSRLRVVVVAPNGRVDDARPEPVDDLGNAFSPALAMNGGGDALLSWVASTAADDGASTIRASFRSVAAGSWATSQDLSLSGGKRSGAPAVAIDPRGNGHAVWVEASPSGDTRLQAARFSRSSGTFADALAISGAATPADVPPGYRANAPRIVVDASGRAVAVWVGADGGIWAARFE